ncbi:alpha/beta hydrolase [Nonomuraea sediminis]|uniref:alpha/beta hydrolase n=1 Tax=Nonomuraea sediminis TaxID=2835864 RepID=UPI001BDC0125|nr:alpha/beta hydrolase [Nonomuraea sediminis]
MNLTLAAALSLTPPASHETLTWGPCPQDLAAECAKVTVPLDYGDPAGRTIQIAISRVRASDAKHRRGVLLANPGGPGGPGLAFAASLSPAMKQVAAQYDLIGFDPRFIGDSTPITCGTGSGQVWQGSPGFERAGFEQAARQVRDIAKRCGARADVLPHATTRNVARDMDSIREALGEPKLSYYGVSYGADLGAVYTQLFPDRVDRFVLDSSTDPDATQYELFQRTGPRSEAGLDEWAAWTAKHGYGLGGTGAQVRATVTRLLERAAREPIRVGDATVDEHRLPLVLSQLIQQQDENDALARTVRDLVDAADGKKVTPDPALARMLQLLSMKGPVADRWMAGQLAVLCDDGGWPAGGWPRGQERYWHDIQRSRATQPVFGALANAITPCAYWPLRPRESGTRIGNRVPVLMVQARRDVNTVYDGALALHRKLAGSRLVTADLRAHGVYTRRAEGYEPSLCAERLVNSYLAGGPLPAKDVDCGKEDK